MSREIIIFSAKQTGKTLVRNLQDIYLDTYRINLRNDKSITDQEISEYINVFNFQDAYRKIKDFCDEDGKINILVLYCSVFDFEFNKCKHLVDTIVDMMIELKLLRSVDDDTGWFMVL